MPSTDHPYRQTLQRKQHLYNEALANGIYTPFVFPWDTLPVLFLALGVIATPILPSRQAQISRYVLTLASLGYMLTRWPYVRITIVSGYGIGLTAFWGLIMTVVLLILHDPGKDFKRIEIRKHAGGQVKSCDTKTGSIISQENGDLRRRTAAGDERRQETDKAVLQQSSLVWQGRPKDLIHLVDWTTDLCTSFRGINWNFRIPIKTYMVPPPPLEENPPRRLPAAKELDEGALSRLQRSAVRNFIYYYFVIDFLKTFMVTDPYFLGIASLTSPSPWSWLANLNTIVPGTTKFVRLSISLAAVVAALTLIFSLNPLFFTVVLPYLLGDKLYSITKCPLLEVWLYPPQWGNMVETLCNKGLAGMWSTWWHQMFRYGISEPSRILVKKLNIDSRSQVARAVQLFVAFGLTAGIHAAASSTTFSIVPSKPLHPFIFFLSQAVGILVQTATASWLTKMAKIPKPVRQVGNFAFVVVFLWSMGPYLTDDFARCGIWLFEPVPISFFRGLGFGPGDTWLPWLQLAQGGRWIGWWDSGHWYSSGIGIC